MIRENVLELLDMLDAGETNSTEEWVNCNCPLAPYTHHNGQDAHPSFGISFSGEHGSVYKCFTCTPEPRSLFHLVFRMWRNGERYPYGLSEFVVKNEVYSEKKKGPEKVWSGVFTPTTIPDSVLSMFYPIDGENNEINWFLESRGISMDASRWLDVRRTPDNDWVVFYFTTPNGDVKLITKRSIHRKDYRRVKIEGIDGKNTGSWFGIHRVSLTQPILIVESELSVLRLASLGYSNAIAAGGAKADPFQIANLGGVRLILGYDADDAGHIAMRTFQRKVKNLFQLSFADWSYVSANDPGDLLSIGSLDDVMSNLKQDVADLGFYVTDSSG